MSAILAADYYVNNARLMEAAAKLWIKPGARVMDATYGKGGFWKRYRPEVLVTNDLFTAEAGHHHDFRDMYPWVDGTFDVVVFDPAYVTPGGRATSTIPEMNEAYGMDTAEPTLASQWAVILDGMRECVRVLRPGGIFMQKCMAYISSGQYQNIPYDVQRVMDLRHLVIVDQFMLVKKSGGPQPKARSRRCPTCKGALVVDEKVYDDHFEWDGKSWKSKPCASCNGTGRLATVQQHSRNNMSFLIVARKPK